MIGNGLLVLSLLAYISISKSVFFKYYTAEEYVVIKTPRGRLQRTNTVSEPVFKEVLNKMWLYGFTEWLVIIQNRLPMIMTNCHNFECILQQVFAVTLSVYPAVTVLINSQYHGNGHPWNDVYFVPVTNYLIFNSGDYLGRILAGMIEWVRSFYITSFFSENNCNSFISSQMIIPSWLLSFQCYESHSYQHFYYAIQILVIAYQFIFIPITYLLWWCVSLHLPTDIWPI